MDFLFHFVVIEAIITVMGTVVPEIIVPSVRKANNK